MACDLRGCNFFLYSLSVQLIWIYIVMGLSSHHVKFYSFMNPPGWFVSMVSTLCLLVAYEWFCDGTFKHHIVEPLMSI